MLTPDQPRDLEIIIQEEHGTRKEKSDVSSPSALPILPLSFVDQKALRMMQKMGYKTGSGLGKNEQGITSVVDVKLQLGKRGLGLNISKLNLSDEQWDFSREEIKIKEKVNWLNCSDANIHVSPAWVKEGPPNFDIIGNSCFCDKEVLENVFKAKGIFDELDNTELSLARARANPFETIKSVFFMNRAALKMANIDAATDSMFTNVDQNCHFSNSKGPFFFADVCAGPGGFTEYVLWRKKWFFKGFGLTLKDDHDFKVTESTCASPATFQAVYGKNGTGNVCDPENIQDFIERVLNETNNDGVHFMMADGGFSVEGNEDIQEILSKNIYVCQCLIALEIVRTHGHFVTKIFDAFTSFSVGLLFLIYQCFEKVSILKPNSSRPANSERYFICHNKKNQATIRPVKEYLWNIAKRLWEIKDDKSVDITEIVPLEVLQMDQEFLDYIFEANTKIAKNQIVALEKLAVFCRNPSLIDVRQEELRRKCLEFWDIPDKPRTPNESYKIETFMSTIDIASEILKVRPRVIKNLSQLDLMLTCLDDFHYAPLCTTEKTNRCNFYVALDNHKVHRLQNNKWVKVKDLLLARGTLLTGEFVKEIVTTNDGQILQRYCLHVIDAFRLGDRKLMALDFKQRREIIEVFCKSMNREAQGEYSVRVRPKTVKKLDCLNPDQQEIKFVDGSYISNEKVLGYGAKSEVYQVSSILFLKTNENQSFHSTHVLRSLVHIAEESNEETQENIKLYDLIDFIQKKL